MAIYKSQITSANAVIENEDKQFISQTQKDNLDDLINNSENITGHVNTFADLPDVATSVGEKWIVDSGTGVWGVNRKPTGTYLSTGTVWTSKFNAIDVINVLTSTSTQKALSANMGKTLKDQVDNLTTADITEDPSALYFTEVRVADTPEVLANTAKITNATHIGEVTGDQALTIALGVVDNDNLTSVSENTIKGRISSGTGSPEDLSTTQVKTILQTTFTETVTADPNTDITAAETETLTDTSNADSLHNHSEIFSGTTVLRTLSNSIAGFISGVIALTIKSDRDLTIHNYNQSTRNDTTSMDEKVLTVNDSGDVLLKRVLPFSKRVQSLTGYVNQTTTLANYLQLDVVIPETGDYVIEWDYIWSYNSGTSDFIGRLLLDGSRLPLDAGQPSYPDHIQEPKDSGGAGVLLENINNLGNTIDTGTNQRHSFKSSYLVQSMTAGAHTIILSWSGSTTNNEAAIYTGNIECRRQA